MSLSDQNPMQIFAFTICPEFHALLEVECKELTGQRPIIRTTLDELKSLLGIFQKIDILIIDLPDDHALSLEIKIFLNNSLGRINEALVLGEEMSKTQNITSFTRMQLNELFEYLRLVFRPRELSVTGWTAIPLSTLVHFESLPFDLFIRLSEDRYVKRVPAYEEVGEDLTVKLASKKITELYCERKNNRDFSMMLINNMINKVDRSYPSEEEHMRANNEVFRTTKEIIQSLGLTNRVIEVCETAIEKMSQDVMNEPSVFGSYLTKLKKNKSLAFQFKLITLTNYIGTQLIMEMDLPKKEEQIKKFIFASYFCDMTLKNPELIKYRRPDDDSELSMDEVNEINFHALKASELVATYKATPKEVALIVQQHHGSFSGIGFPTEKSYQLLPLSKVLIVSQDLAFCILSDEGAPALEVLKNFLKKNECAGLSELMNSLEKVLLE
jgi:hypothetical protein